jgi:hypothetical protein
MKRARLLPVVLSALAIGLGLAGTSVPALGQEEAGFPHERHQGLFPLCTGCHEGIPLGDAADSYPEPASCSGCHDGVREVLVTWRGPTPDVDNVLFDHREHADELAAAGDPPQECASCHIAPGGGRLEVADEVQLGTCWSCHAHEAAEHQVDAQCTTCHVPLAETRYDLARIESLPVPADHEASSFLGSDHGRLAEDGTGRCATCHTRERCVSCHVDVERDAIAALPVAPAGMALPPATARYEEPESHDVSDWLATHGLGASRDACATCHTSNDCAACHVPPLPEVVGQLPAAADVLAPGAGIEARAPESHGRMFFMAAHTTLASAGDASCATCHEESFCVSCHDGPVGGGYHPPEFLSRHTASAFGRDVECTNCHNTQVFCRACHVQVGLTPAGGGRLGPGYHDDGPLWLIRHGQAARQNLESCASCHRQVDCTQCHGVLGAFKVSPHSSGFDAERAWSRSPRTCFACHIGNPLNGNQP